MNGRIYARLTFITFSWLLLSPTAHGQTTSSGGVVNQLDPSARSAGMGGASSAVFRGSSLNDWANPALLGYRTGVAYDWSREQLVPNLADDVFLRSHRLTIANWGVGLSLAGRPVGGEQLHYGTSYVTDFSGQVIAEFESFEDADSWGLGVNLLELVDHLAFAAGSELTLSRFGDISLGYSKKDLRFDLAPASVTRDGVDLVAEATTTDVGLAIRLTPYDSIGRPGSLPAIDDRLGGLRVDLGFARSTRNRDDSAIGFSVENTTTPIPREERWGYSLSVETAFPAEARSRLPGWIAPVMTRLFTFTAAWDDVEYKILDASNGKDDYSGFEIGFADIVTYRRGTVRTTRFFDTSWGYSIGFNAAGAGGFHYHRASVPTETGRTSQTRHGVTTYVDVGGLLRGR